MVLTIKSLKLIEIGSSIFFKIVTSCIHLVLCLRDRQELPLAIPPAGDARKR